MLDKGDANSTDSMTLFYLLCFKSYITWFAPSKINKNLAS